MTRIKSVIFQDSHHQYGDKEAVATMDDGSEQIVFHWFSDELTFREEELIAMTLEQARDLKQERDLSSVMTDLNRYFPVINPRVSKNQIGLSLIERGKIAIVLTPPMIIEQFESLIKAEDLTALYLDVELKSFAARRPIRGE